MCYLPLTLLAVLPPPSIPSLSPCLCSAREHAHGNASHHGTEKGTGGGFVPRCELQAVLQDSGKHPAGDTSSWLRVCRSLAPLSRCTRFCSRGRRWSSHGALKQGRALVLQLCNKMWKQRFGNRGYRRGTEEKVSSESGEEVDNRGTWVSEEVQ